MSGNALDGRGAQGNFDMGVPTGVKLQPRFGHVHLHRHVNVEDPFETPVVEDL